MDGNVARTNEGEYPSKDIRGNFLAEVSLTGVDIRSWKEEAKSILALLDRSIKLLLLGCQMLKHEGYQDRLRLDWDHGIKSHEWDV